MISRETFIESVQAEVAIIKHLHTKLPKANLDYRPTPSQRSLSELLAYIPCTPAAVPFFISGDMSNIRASMDKIQNDARNDFVATLDREVAAFIKLVNSFKETDFATKEATLPTGQRVKLAAALLNFGLKFLTGYRMQLFLYLKAGQPELSTLNCWVGVDSLPK
jgi:hypothetical protein